MLLFIIQCISETHFKLKKKFNGAFASEIEIYLQQ